MTSAVWVIIGGILVFMGIIILAKRSLNKMKK